MAQALQCRVLYSKCTGKLDNEIKLDYTRVAEWPEGLVRFWTRFGLNLLHFMEDVQKHYIFVFFLVLRHVWIPFWTPNLFPFIEFKKGVQKGSDGRTNGRN